MDLSDGSDVGEELDYDLDENDILGGSDDEEKGQGNGQYGHGSQQRVAQENESEYLDLASGTGEFEGGVRNDDALRVSPVKVRNVSEPKEEAELHMVGAVDEEEDPGDYDPSTSSVQASHLLDDDDEDDEDKSERSRFYNERKPLQPPQNSTSSGSGSHPIRSLGMRHSGHMMRGGGPYNGPRPFRGRGPPPRHFMRAPPFMNRPGHGMMMPHFPPPLMGRMEPPPVYQFQEGIFTDFNDPGMRKQMPHSLQLSPPRTGRFPPPRQSFTKNNPNTNLRQVRLPSPSKSNPNSAPPCSSVNNTGQAGPVNSGGPQFNNQNHFQPGGQPLCGSNDRKVEVAPNDSNPAVIINRSEPQQPKRSNEAEIYVLKSSLPQFRPQRPPRFKNSSNGSVRHTRQMDSHPPFPQQFHPQQMPMFDPGMSNQSFPPNQGGQFIPPPNSNWMSPQSMSMMGAPPMNVQFNPQFPQQFQHAEFMPQPLNSMPPNQFVQHPPFFEPQFNPGTPLIPAQFVNSNYIEYQHPNPTQPPQFLNQQPANYQDPHLQHNPQHYHAQELEHRPPQRLHDDEDLYRESRRYDSRGSRERSERYRRDERDDRSPMKRRYEDERYDPPREYRKPRLQERLGPPPERPPKDNQDEIEKIIQETKKELGLGEDDEYLRKIEEQKRKREEILRQKEARRKGFVKESSSAKSEKAELKAPSQNPPANVATSKHSVYLNPKTFNGDLLSALDSKLKKINMSIVPSSVAKDSARAPASISNVAPTSAGLKDESKSPVKKGKTILRVVKNKKGEIISKSKVVVMKSQHIPK